MNKILNIMKEDSMYTMPVSRPNPCHRVTYLSNLISDPFFTSNPYFNSFGLKISRR